MSYVTNLVLGLGHDDVPEEEPGKIVEVNRFFGERHGRGLVSLDDPTLPSGWYGGTKYLEAHLYVGAFNYLDLDAFLAHLRAIDWAEPESVQLFIMDQHDERWSLIDVMGRTPNRSDLYS